MRVGIWLSLLCAAAALGGCTVQSELPGPPVILGASPAPALLTPPAVEAAGEPGAAGGRDGTYAGTAAVLTTDGGLCIRPLPISAFVVQGVAVRYGRFHGIIDPQGGLQMVYGGTWIVGQFDGAVFRGQLSVPGARQTPGCTYLVTLARTGP